MYDSVITSDKIIDTDAKSYDEETKTIPKKKRYAKQKVLLAFLLITIGLLVAVSIDCYLIKYEAKQKHVLSFYITNNSKI